MDFNDFYNHEEESVRQAATILAEAKQGFENGELTKEQYDELIEDVLQIEQMQELADSLERKIAIQKAAQLLMQLAKALPI